MSKFELKLPQMGESVAEATLTNWLKEVGDTIEMDEAVFEIATDKVDSEVPSEVDGVLLEKRFDVDDVVKVGEVVAVIQIEGEVDNAAEASAEEEVVEEEPVEVPAGELEAQMAEVKESVSTPDFSSSERFYSPLVKNIAKEENVSMDELEAIAGTGKEGRVTKNDIMAYLESRSNGSGAKTETSSPQQETKTEKAATPLAPKETVTEKPKESKVQVGAGDEVIPLTRMGKLIAHHMIESV